MEKEPTPIDMKNFRETTGKIPLNPETVLSYTPETPSAVVQPETVKHHDSMEVLGQNIRTGQVIQTAPQYSVSDFEKKGNETALVLVNTETGDRISIPVSELEKIKKPEDIELFSINRKFQLATSQFEHGLEEGRIDLMQRAREGLQQNLIKSLGVLEKDPTNVDLQHSITAMQDEILQTNKKLEGWTPGNEKHLRELQFMIAVGKKNNVNTAEVEAEFERVINLSKSKPEIINEASANQTPEIPEIIEATNIQNPKEEKIEQEKSPAELVTEARNKYLRLYAKSFKEKGSFKRGLLNLGHATGLVQKDSEKFLSPKAKAAKEEYETLKNSIQQEKFDRLRGKGKSEAEVIAVIQRYRKITRQLDLLEQESEILKQARDKAFSPKKSEALKKVSALWNKLTPTQKKALGLATSIGVGVFAGSITGGATLAIRLARIAAGTGAGKLASMLGEKIWKSGAGGKYETKLEEIKQKYLSGEMTPARYQEEKEALEILENKAKTIKTAATIAVAGGAALGTGATLNALDSINTPSVPITTSETQLPETTPVTTEGTGLGLNHETATANEIPMPPMEQLHDFSSVSPDAVAKPGESIWKIVERQIEHDPKLAETLGVHGNPTNADLVKVLRGFGYISNEGDVRIADFNNTAYELATVDGQPVIHEYHNGQFVETRTLATGSEQGTVDTHEVFHDKELKVETQQPEIILETIPTVNTDVIPDIETNTNVISEIDTNTTTVTETPTVLTSADLDTIAVDNSATVDTKINPETALDSNQISTDPLLNKSMETFVQTEFGSSNDFGSWENNLIWNQIKTTDAKSFLGQPIANDSPYKGTWIKMQQLSGRLGMQPSGTVEEYLRALKLKELQLQQQNTGY